MNLEAPRRDLGDVEHLIDEMTKVGGRRGDAIDGRHLARSQVAVDAVLEELHEADDRVERSAQLVRDVGEEFAFRGVRARDFAVEPLELRGTTGDASGLPAFANEAVAEQRNREETQSPERDSQGLEGHLVRDDERPHERVGDLDAHGRDERSAQRGAFSGHEDCLAAGDQCGRYPLARGPLHDRAQRRIGGGCREDGGVPQHAAHGVAGLQGVDFGLTLRGARQRTVARDQTADHEQQRGREEERDLAQRESGECCAHHGVD